MGLRSGEGISRSGSDAAPAGTRVDGNHRPSGADALLTDIADLLESLARCQPLERIIEKLGHLVEDRLDGVRCLIGIRDGSGRLRHQSGRTERALADLVDELPIATRPVSAEETLSVDDLAVDDPRAFAALHAIGVCSCWVTAAVGSQADEALGSVVVLHPQDRAPTGEEPALLSCLANVVAIAVERSELQRSLEHRVSHDDLTGLANRQELVAKILERSVRRPDDPVTLLFIDIDRFKVVNDSLGHVGGDVLLRLVAERFRRAVRPGDTVGRIGGDEFVVLCEATLDEAGAGGIASRLAAAVREPFMVQTSQVVVTASIGITTNLTGDDPEALLRDADLAMYEAKRRGRDRIAVFEYDLRRKARDRLDVEGALRHALRVGQLETRYQPQVNLADDSVTSVEALVRWARPGHGIIEPDAFIPIAEDSGLIVPLGRWVLERAVADASRWRAEGLDLCIAVNVSARELSDPGLVEVAMSVLERYQFEPSDLCLEVTETDLVLDPQASAAALVRLKELGIRIAIDDFGTGYATLDYVRRFSMADVLKIDRSFVSGVADPESKDRAIVSAAIILGQALGFEMVAEGVETEAQLGVLRELGCDYVQGWLFGRPVRSPDLPGLVRSVVRT